jgi:hypothetical protein
MVEIVFDPDFTGPDLVAIAPAIPNTPDEVLHVSWKNTRQEALILEEFPDRSFVLHVDDLVDIQHAAWRLGLPLKVEQNLIEETKLSLCHQKSYNWRKFTETNGEFRSKNAILKLAAELIRANTPSVHLTNAAKNVVLDGVSPQDADLMLRLSFLETKHVRP